METVFEYRTGTSLAHRLDPRAKLALVCLLSLCTAAAGWAASLLVTALLGSGLIPLGIGIRALLKALRFFLFLLVLIVLTRAMVVPGEPLVQVSWIPLSVPGLVQGSLVALRFFNMMVLGIIFTATTRPSDLNAALQWAARPLPFIPEKRLGMIFSLALRFLPMILRQARETRQAFCARNGQRRKNPVRRTILLATALISRILSCADDAALSMEARCYTHDRTLPPFYPSGREKSVLLAGTALCLLLVWL